MAVDPAVLAESLVLVKAQAEAEGLHEVFRAAGADWRELAKRAEGTPLTAASRPAFDRLAGVLRAQLASAASSPMVASAQ